MTFSDQATLTSEIDELQDGLKPKVRELNKMEGTVCLKYMPLYCEPKPHLQSVCVCTMTCMHVCIIYYIQVRQKQKDLV